LDVVQYLADAEAFNRELGTEHYRAGAGLQATLELAPIYQRYFHLFEGDRFDEIATWDLDPVQVRYLQEFVAHGYLGNQTKEFDERFAATEAALTVDWDERPIPYREVPVLIANEGDAVRRHDLEQRQLTVLDSALNPILDEREKNLQRQARSFGHGDYVALYDHLRGFHLTELTESMQRFIAETDDIYFSALDTYLSEMRILRDDGRKCDLSRIFRAPVYDLWFPSDRAVSVLHSSLRDLGILLEDQENIHLDTAERPLKSPRAFCSPIRVPEDVRLVVKPTGGVSDYDSLFHEAGHAEHFGNVDRTQPFAFRRLGDDSVTESYAFLMQHLMNDPLWLDRHLGLTRPESYLQLAGFHRLYFLRRYGTKLVYEQELHRADEPGDVAPLYDELFTRNLGVGYGPESHLADVDAGFYAAAYVRAWTLEAQMRRYLQREFDDEWFRNPKAGKFMIELWRDGQKHPADALARFMGYEGLDPTYVAADIRGLMGTT
jgi:hypothetical protein